MEGKYFKLAQAILLVLSVYYLLVFVIRNKIFKKAEQGNVKDEGSKTLQVESKTKTALQPSQQNVVSHATPIRDEKFSFLGSSFAPDNEKIDKLILNEGINTAKPDQGADLAEVKHGEHLSDSASMLTNANNVNDENEILEPGSNAERNNTKGKGIIQSPSEIFDYGDEQPSKEKTGDQNEIAVFEKDEDVQADISTGTLEETTIYESELAHDIEYEPVIQEQQPQEIEKNNTAKPSSKILENLNKIRGKQEIDEKQEEEDFYKLMAAKKSILKTGTEIKQNGIVYNSEKRERIVQQLLLADESNSQPVNSAPGDQTAAAEHELKQDNNKGSEKGKMTGKRKETTQRKNKYLNNNEILFNQ